MFDTTIQIREKMNKRSQFIAFKVTPEERQAILDEAQMANLSISDFIRKLISKQLS